MSSFARSSNVITDPPSSAIGIIQPDVTRIAIAAAKCAIPFIGACLISVAALAATAALLLVIWTPLYFR